MSFTIIGKRFTPTEFAAYVAGIKMDAGFAPSFVVVHNTGAPTLAERPNGFSEQNMRDLEEFYSNQGWNGSPHCFVDDAGIWVLNPINKRGTHSPSWNGSSFGVEMLGDYDSDAFTTGRGAKVRANAVLAVGTLLKKIGVTATGTTVRFHKEDPKTTHKDCPGAHVVKGDFLAAVQLGMTPSPKPATPSPAAGWTVYRPDGSSFQVADSETHVVRSVWESDGGTLNVDSVAKKITLVPKP